MTKGPIGRVCAILVFCLFFTATVTNSVRAVTNDEIKVKSIETLDTPDKVIDSNPSSSIGRTKLDITAEAGSTVNVCCKVGNAKRVLGIQESLSYDASALTFVAQKLGTNDSNFDFEINTNNDGEIIWNEMFSAKGTDFVFESDIVTLSFKAVRDISAGESVLTYTVDEFFDKDIKDLEINNIKTYVSSKGEDMSKTVFYGDVNFDGNIDSMDSLLILRASVGIENFDSLQNKLANVDMDSFVSSSDALTVLRYSVGLVDSGTMTGTEEIVTE